MMLEARRVARTLMDVPGSEMIQCVGFVSRWPTRQVELQVVTDHGTIAEFRRHLLHRPTESGTNYKEVRQSRAEAAVKAIPGLEELKLDHERYDIMFVAELDGAPHFVMPPDSELAPTIEFEVPDYAPAV